MRPATQSNPAAAHLHSPNPTHPLLNPPQDHQAIPLHPSGLPLTAKPLIDAGLLFDDEGASIKTSKHRLARIVSTGGGWGAAAAACCCCLCCCCC